MPPRRNKKKASARAASAEEAVSSPTVQSVFLHPDDDIERALRWIEKDGNITGARLVKRLPRTAQKIRIGEVSPTFDFAKELCDRVVARSEARSAQRGVALFGEGFGLISISKALTNRILPTTMPLYIEVMGDMHCNLRRPIREAAKTDEWKASKPIALARTVKQAFDDTCTKWEERLGANLFNGHPAGTFRQCCSLFEAPLEEFDKLLAEGFYCQISDASQGDASIYDCLLWDATRMDDFIVANHLLCGLDLSALEILKGVDKGSSTACWECGKMAVKTTACSGCKAALYCGRICQVKAWKDGHKMACPVLAVQCEYVRASLVAVDQAHRTGMLEGVQLSQNFDYSQMIAVHCIPDNAEYNTLTEDLGLPSMQFFYQNLARVINGEWWLYDESETTTAKEFKEASRVNVGNGLLEAESEYFADLTLYLAYDYFGCASRRGVEDPKAVTAMFAKAPALVAKRFGATMPRKVLLGLYQQQVPSSSSCPYLRSETFRLKHRKRMKFSVFKHLREEYHKLDETCLTAELLAELAIG